MKKTVFLIAAALMMASTTFAQIKNVARECVLFELMTGVHCGNCPAADEAIEQMVNEGLHIAPVCYQAPSYSVPELTCDEVAARVAYYSAMGYPTLYVDGSTGLPGGSSGMNYMYYLPYYQSQIAKTSPFTIGMNLESVGGNLYRVNCHVEQVGDCSGNDVRVFIVLTQSHIPYSWGGGDYVNWNVRDMIPTEQGTLFAGPTMDFSEEFEIIYPLEDCQLVAWVQDYVNPREVYQAVMMSCTVDGVAENEAPLCRVYPNPATMQVFVEAESAIKSVKVYDMLGNLVETIAVDGKTLNVNVSDYSEGVYLFNVIDSNGKVSSQRVVVTR